MIKNMGSTDKIIRIAVALLFGVLYFTDIITGTLGVVLLVLAIVFLLTSFISYCPLYTPLKMSTLKEKKDK